MRRHLMILVVSALWFAAVDRVASAEEAVETIATPQGQSQLRLAQAGRAGRYDSDDDEDEDRWDRRRGPTYPGQQPRNWDRDRGGGREGWRDRSDEGRRAERDPQRRGFPARAMYPLVMGRFGMTQVMMALMDTDGDGSISLQEFQAAQERIFKAMDADKDGRLTLDEIRNFHAGQPAVRPGQ